MHHMATTGNPDRANGLIGGMDRGRKKKEQRQDKRKHGAGDAYPAVKIFRHDFVDFFMGH